MINVISAHSVKNQETFQPIFNCLKAVQFLVDPKLNTNLKTSKERYKHTKRNIGLVETSNEEYFRQKNKFGRNNSPRHNLMSSRKNWFRQK